MNRVVLSHITKRINNQLILDDVSYSFCDKGLYCLVGDSGSGKTSLLDIIAGVDTRYLGDCLINGTSLLKLDDQTRSFIQLSSIGYLRQTPDLIELESCLDNMILRAKPVVKIDRAFIDKARSLMKTFNLKDKTKQRVNSLSGGERSRLSLASIIAVNPDVILADEPTAGLDKDNAQFIFKTLKSLSKEKTVIVVTHDTRLAVDFADKILSLKNKTITEKNVDSSKDFNMVTPTQKKAKTNGLLSTWFSHSFKVLNKKKWRTVFSMSLMSFSMFSLGLSIYMKSDLNDRLNSCLRSLTGENSIIMKKKNSGESSIGKVIAAPMSSISSIKDDYQDYILDSGITYLADFENYFPQENNGYFLLKGHEYLIKDVSVRTFSDFLWLDSFKSSPVYPEMPQVMERSQIVLGLPYEQMSNTCFRIGINRTYEDLGNYIRHQQLDLLLKMQNDSWGYIDEQSFNVIGVTRTAVPTILHLDHKFNEYVLEHRMRFPSSDERDDSLPWILQKLFYIEPTIQKGDFISLIRNNDSYQDFIFEPSSYLYEKTHDRDGFTTSLNRLYVYEADKRSLGFGLPYLIGTNNEICSYSLLGEYSYSVFPDSLASGFYNPFFLGSSLESVEQSGDASSRVKLDQAYSTIKTKDDVFQGSYLLPRTSGLTFSSDFRGLTKGREPKGMEEVCISTAIVRKLGEIGSCYVSGAVSWKQEGEYLLRDYRSAELKVVGIVDSDFPIIYGLPTWTIDFWRDVLGMSSFLLEPTAAVFYTNGNDEPLLKDVSSKYQGYAFSCPSLVVETSLSLVTGYLTIILSFASFLVLLMAVILFITVSLLTSIEQKKEGRTLFYMGFTKGDIHNMYVTNSTTLIFGSLFGAIAAISCAEIFVDKAIQNSFGVALNFYFDGRPLAAIFVFGILTLLGVSVMLKRWVFHREFRLEKR